MRPLASRPLRASTVRARLGRAGVAAALALVAGAGLAWAIVGPTGPPRRPPVRLPPGMGSPLVAVDRLHGGHFVLASTGVPVELRGFDYQPLVKVPGHARRYVNVTFSPGHYRHGHVAAITRRWEAEGYDAVRVFLNPTEIGSPSGPGLDPAYLANLADLVTTAAVHRVRTIVTVGSLPTHGGFTPRGRRDFGLYNQDYLDPAFLAAEQRYLTALVDGLRADEAPLADILWELKGEQDWNLAAAPLDWRSGTVRTANGGRYDMASPTARAAMERANLANWANRLAGVLHRLVRGSLVGVGVYSPSVRRHRWAVSPGPLFSSATGIDFVDVHVYPNLGPEAAQMAGFHAEATHKPVIMGEFGATRAAPVKVASAALVTWQEQSCHLGGLSVSGWLLWTWDSSADPQFWDAQAHGGEIAHALSPATRPDPCG